MKRRILILLLILMLGAFSLAEGAVHLDYSLYGEAFHGQLPPEEDYFLTCGGEKYSLLDDRASFSEAYSIYGGKSRAVYEYTLPAGTFDGETPVGSMIIDVPYRAELTVLEGNRRSGEYRIVDSRILTSWPGTRQSIRC